MLITEKKYFINVPKCTNKKVAWGKSKNSAINNYYNSNFNILKTAGITRSMLLFCNN